MDRKTAIAATKESCKEVRPHYECSVGLLFFNTKANGALWAPFALAGVLRHLAYLDGVRPLGALADFKGHFVSFAEFVERNADELVGMEEKILLLTRDLDKAEAFIREASDDSFLHMQLNVVCLRYQCSELEKRLEPDSTGSALVDATMIPPTRQQSTPR